MLKCCIQSALAIIAANLCLNDASALQDPPAMRLLTAFDYAVAAENPAEVSSAADAVLAAQGTIVELLTIEEHADLLARVATELAVIGENDRAFAAMQEALDLNRALLAELEAGGSVFTTLNVYAAREALYTRLLDASDLFIRMGAATVGGSYKAEADAMFDAYFQPGDIALQTMGATRFLTQDSGEPFQLVRVFYGTNRAARSGDPNRAYSNGRGDLTYGAIEVSVPNDRAVGAIPRPGIIGGEQESLHVILRSITRFEGEGFGGRLRDSVNQAASARDEVFIFIHGHGVRFDQAARQTAQLAVDLDIRDGAVMYSWPNGESFSAYQVSQASVGISSRRLADFLETVMAEVGDTDIHIIAHSMGNRVLMNALERIYDPDAAEPMLSHVFWASADIDADLFEEALSDLSGVAEGMTAYTSAQDRALQVSSSLAGGFIRAGQSEPLANVARIVTTVDTTRLSAGPIGHADFSNSLIEDMQAIVWLSLPPEGRCILTPIEIDEGARFWRAVDDRPECGKDAYGRALWAIRNFGDDAEAAITTAMQNGSIPERAHDFWDSVVVLIRETTP